MKNLKEALTLILKAVETGMKAYQDQKINVGEWIAIGMKIIAWVGIFRNLKNILADIVNATQEEFTQMHAELCEGFDIPQDQIEEKIEQSLSLVLLIISMIWGKKEVELALKAKNGIQAGSNMA